MTFEEYVAIDAVNWSSLKRMGKSPAEYHYWQQVERADTDTFRVGRAAHCAALEPNAYEHRYAVFSGAKRQGKAWEAFAAENKDRTILTQRQHQVAQESGMAVHWHPASGPYLDADGFVESTIQWVHPSTGLKCKSRPDKLTDDAVVDLKFVADATDWAMSKAVLNYGYHAQLAFYLDATRAVGAPRDRVVIIAAEKTEPFHVAVYELGAEEIEAGRELYMRYLNRLVECLAADEWPGLNEDKEQLLALPPWGYEAGGGDVMLSIGGEEVAL